MHRIRLVPFVVVLSACSLISSPTVTTDVSDPTPPVVTTTSTTTTTAPSTTTTSTTAPPATLPLAVAAIEGVETFAAVDQTTDRLECALPDVSFTPVCEAMDEADATPLDAVEAAINGMVAFALDPNSAYLDPAALALARGFEHSEDHSGMG